MEAPRSQPLGPPLVRRPPLELLACPLCKEELTESSAGLECPDCHNVWPERNGVIDFTAAALEDDGWHQRQREMVGWYRDLASNSEQAAHCLRTDYRSIAAQLESLSGAVLDVGGGAGVTRHYLDPAVRYVNVDPSTEWLETDWASVASSFPVRSEPMFFARGVGERLPCRSGGFDAVLSLWSLNHAASVEPVLEECGRVLRKDGLLFLVLEDMEPRWRDLARAPLRRERTTVIRKLAGALRSEAWPIQSDHVRVDEGELLKSLSGRFSLVRREWVGAGPPSYLSFALRRR